jgi:hypothetical protein
MVKDKGSALKKLIVIFLLLPTTAFSGAYFNPLSEEDIAYQTVYTMLVGVDWIQTKNFRAKGKKESSPILGTEPTQQEVDLKIMLGVSACFVFIWVLPEKYRKLFQISFITAELSAIRMNYIHGVRISKHF